MEGLNCGSVALGNCPSKPPPPSQASLPFQPSVGSLASKRRVELSKRAVSTQYSGCGACAATTCAFSTITAPEASVPPLSVGHLSFSETGGGSGAGAGCECPPPPQPARSAEADIAAIARRKAGGWWVPWFIVVSLLCFGFMA